jgi:DNA-binding GntR family transcriptional regulator
MVISATDRSQLRHGVASTIRELIVAGRARPGELLRLAPLADEMDMSITPVREALLLLAQDGWVIQEPNRGFRVAEIRRSDVEDTYFVQRFVAGELAARAALKATAADVAELREINAQIIAFGDHGDAEVERLNYSLHQRIYVKAEAPRLEWFIDAASRFVPRQFWATIPGWRELNRTGHEPIVARLEVGDAAGAREAMSSHIHAAGELLLRWLDSISFWSSA